MWDPIAYALGFLNCDQISARCMLTIFQFFATKTDASVLRMLNGAPAERLVKPILEYIQASQRAVHSAPTLSHVKPCLTASSAISCNCMLPPLPCSPRVARCTRSGAAGRCSTRTAPRGRPW